MLTGISPIQALQISFHSNTVDANSVGYVEQSRCRTSHRSTSESDVDNEQNEKARSTIIKRQGSHSEEHTALIRVIPQRVQYSKCNNLELASREFYLMLVLLQNYQTLNFTGFQKIFKKSEKLFQTILVYSEALEEGDRARAMKRLRDAPLEVKRLPAVKFRVGLFATKEFFLFLDINL
ncbi:unnamed protein product [Rotaria magnacalcarata]|uniref:SPX domain-containing protein n=2 Tax=Rotaria magnacalcarata TaxID=392030 RepID=A0A816Y3U2_9BILA|nr:unnamed protein product [Rotaria magnacalcarata]